MPLRTTAAIGGLALLLALLVSLPASAAPPGPGLVLARLKYGGGGDWYSNPTSLPNLARALEERLLQIGEGTDSEVRLVSLRD